MGSFSFLRRDRDNNKIVRLVFELAVTLAVLINIKKCDEEQIDATKQTNYIQNLTSSTTFLVFR